MKKKVWILSPYIIFITLLMIVMASLSIMWDLNVFLLEICISVVAFMLVVIEFYKFKSYVRSVVRNADYNLCNAKTKVLEKISIPVVVVGEKEDIIFFNKSFSLNVNNGKDCTGETINQFIPGKTFKEIFKNKGLDVVYAEKRYTVFGALIENFTIIYFIDNTYFKKITFEYNESRPAVCIAVFDNKEEILRESAGGRDAQIIADFEKQLQDWVDKTSGFLKKFDGNRYMMILEDRHVKKFIDEKFSILEKIRSIKIDDRQSATISIGIGRGASNLRESEIWAKKALDMALGRGGDQVAIKNDNSYKFFGGKSKDVEKRDKVRTRVIAATMSDYIKSSDSVLIMGHKFSDLDSVGASVGMWSAITKGQKVPAYVVINKQQSLATQIIKTIENNGSKNVFINPFQAMSILSEKTLLIIVDTHSQSFLESKEIYNSCKNVVVIDHHRMMVDHIENSVVFYLEPHASSTSEMVTELTQYLGENSLDSFEAEALLAGIMLDTKNFVLKTGVRTFESAAFLKRKGADTIEVKKFFSNSLNVYKEKSKLISDAEIFNNCAITFTDNSDYDMRIACAQAADELLEIQDVKASFVMYSFEKGVNISARSMGDINVQLIMEELGGGGHQTMAGAQLKDVSIDNVRKILVKIINSLENKR